MEFPADSPGEGKLAPMVTTARRVMGLPTALPGFGAIDKACSGVIEADAATEDAGIRVTSAEPRSRVTPCGGITAGRTSSVECEASAAEGALATTAATPAVVATTRISTTPRTYFPRFIASLLSTHALVLR